MRDEQSRHLRIVHPNSKAIAGDARLADFKDGAANSVLVANANLIVGKTFNREVLSKLPVFEIIPGEFALPILVRFDLIDHDGPMFATVAIQITLTITIEIEPSSKHTPGHSALPDCSADNFALPRDFARKAHIDGEKLRHGDLQLKLNRVQNNRKRESIDLCIRPDARGEHRNRPQIDGEFNLKFNCADGG
jgi:hypothetical protein